MPLWCIYSNSPKVSVSLSLTHTRTHIHTPHKPDFYQLMKFPRSLEFVPLSLVSDSQLCALTAILVNDPWPHGSASAHHLSPPSPPPLPHPPLTVVAGSRCGGGAVGWVRRDEMVTGNEIRGIFSLFVLKARNLSSRSLKIELAHFLYPLQASA